MRRPGAAVGLIVTLALIGCGSGSKHSATSRRTATNVDRPRPAATTTIPVGKPPDQFGPQVTRLCADVVPRLNRTVAQLKMVNAQAGNPLAKLPKLALLFRQISTDFGTLHAGLARLRAPTAHSTAFYTFVHDLFLLRRLSATMAADLSTGTIAGLNRYRPLAARFSARGAVLEAHRKRAALPHSACRNIGA